MLNERYISVQPMEIYKALAWRTKSTWVSEKLEIQGISIVFQEEDSKEQVT